MAILIRVILNPKKLFEIEGAWNAFIDKCGKNPFFLSGFVKQFMEFYHSHGWTPLVLVISADNVIVGIAPLMTRKKFGVRFVKSLFKPWFSPDFIFNDQYREACATHTLHFLFRTLQCQFADLPLPAESPNLQILKQKCKTNGIYFWAKPEIGHCIIPIQYSWHEFRKLRGYNFRRRFKRLKRNLDRAGSWRIICVEEGNNESDAIKRILDVERRSWKQAWRTRKDTEMDHELLMTLKGSRHSARTEPLFKWRVWFLEINDQTLAYTLVLQYKKTAVIMKTSFDERYRKFQPGIYINNAAIRELFDRGQVRNIDWLTDLPFHRNWTSVSLPRVRIMMSQNAVIRTTIGFMFASPYTRYIRSRVSAIVDPLLSRVPTIGDLISL